MVKTLFDMTAIFIAKRCNRTSNSQRNLLEQFQTQNQLNVTPDANEWQIALPLPCRKAIYRHLTTKALCKAASKDKVACKKLIKRWIKQPAYVARSVIQEEEYKNLNLNDNNIRRSATLYVDENRGSTLVKFLVGIENVGKLSDDLRPIKSVFFETAQIMATGPFPAPLLAWKLFLRTCDVNAVSFCRMTHIMSNAVGLSRAERIYWESFGFCNL